MTTSLSQDENPIDEQIKTAIIYSISDLGSYLVEIRHQAAHYFIGTDGKSEQFKNLDAAKQAAISHGAEQAYQALSRLYQEVEATTAHLSASADGQQYDYIKVALS